VKDDLESGGHSVYLLTDHLVWCVKSPRKVLTRDVETHAERA
jgi:REP element-mobilizing transposase RayT